MIVDRRTLLLSAAVLAVAPCTRAEEPQRMRRAGPPPPLVATGDSAHLTLNGAYNLPTVQVTIGDRAPLWFGIDTGAAGYGRITAAAAERLNLPVVGEALASDPSGKNPQKSFIYHCPGLTLGEIRFGEMDIEELTFVPKSGPAIDGILGLDLFDGFLLTFDRRVGQVEVTRGALPEADGKSVFQAPVDWIIRVDLKIGDRTVTADLDTGQARSGLIVPPDIAADLPLTGAPRIIGKARTVSQVIDMSAQDIAVPVMLGDHILPISDVAWPAPAPIANLGWKAFAGLALTVDATNRRIRIA